MREIGPLPDQTKKRPYLDIHSNKYKLTSQSSQK